MSIATLFSNLTVDILSTVVIIAVLGFTFYSSNRFIKKREDKWHKGILAIFFLLSIIMLGFGVILIMFVWGFDFNTYFASIQTDVIAYLEKSIGAFIGSSFAILAALFILRISKLAFKSIGAKPGPLQKRKKTIGKVTLSIIRYLVAVVATLVVLAIWGVNVMPALAGLGILGLVIGLGAQKFINDLISGFFIIFEHHFDVGDKIEVAGFTGEVTDIGLKTTKIRNWKGEVKILANGQITTLVNYSKNTSVAEVEFSIAYEADIQKAIDILNESFPAFSQRFIQIVEPPQILGVIRLDDSSVVLKVICKTLNNQHYSVERGLRQYVKETLDKNGIEIPFPQVMLSQKKDN